MSDRNRSVPTPAGARDAPRTPQGSVKKEFQRAYKACVQCRAGKAKCEVEVRDDGTQAGACNRCRRTGRDCVFTEERAWKSQKRKADHDPVDCNARYQTPRTTSDGARAGPSTGLTGSSQDIISDSMMRTVVASGNDALNLLFEAATHDGVGAAESTADRSKPSGGDSVAPRLQIKLHIAPSVSLSKPSEEDLTLWRKCHFVKSGWLTAQEAITYVDLFDQNLAVHSPILKDGPSHASLLSEEPLLCCTILALSSRYHTLPGAGAESRGHYIHQRLWEYCQGLIMRIIMGQERGPKSRLRSIGSIEALLLMTEWHPRALHFLPAGEGSDPCLIYADSGDTDDQATTSNQDSPAKRWLQDVVEPARRSDRMSWMLLGCAVSLAHEIGIFDDEAKIEDGPFTTPRSLEIVQERHIRTRRLLYVYAEQLSSRVGCTSIVPQHLSGIAIPREEEERYGLRLKDNFLYAWIELTKLMKYASDMIFPSPSLTSRLLKSGRYIAVLEHFRPLLEDWRKRFSPGAVYYSRYQDHCLKIEYHFLRLSINSIGMQAAVERTISQSESDPAYPNFMDSTDHQLIQDVVDDGCKILREVIDLAVCRLLRYCPVRMFLRITTSAIYLLKGLSLGVWTTQLRASLDLLDCAIDALRRDTLDDMHLASRYATLLEVQVARLRRKFVPSSRPPRLSTGPSPAERQQTSETQAFIRGVIATPGPGLPGYSGGELDVEEPPADDWVALPFDPSMAPFGAGGSAMQTFPNLDDGMLDFLWNLPS